METAGRESIVSRLFGFGRRKAQSDDEAQTSAGETAGEVEAEESGFARTEESEHAAPPSQEGAELDVDGPAITVPEQVIRVRTGPLRVKNETMNAIGESFRELTTLLGSINERLDRSDSRTGDLAEQLKEVPEYLRSLPALHEEQNAALRAIGERMAEGNTTAAQLADAVARIPGIQEEQVRAILSLAERVAEGADATHEVASAVARIPEEMRNQTAAAQDAMRQATESQREALREASAAQEKALENVANAQRQTARVVQATQQKSLQLYHRATNQTIAALEKRTRREQTQMQMMLDESISNMKRMFILAGAFAVAAIVAVIGLLWLR